MDIRSFLSNINVLSLFRHGFAKGISTTRLLTTLQDFFNGVGSLRANICVFS